MGIKNTCRLRRARKTRLRIKDQDLHRLTVYNSSKHFYAQIFDSSGSTVVASASTNEKDSGLKNNVQAAEEIGKTIAERAMKNGVKNVVFDRSGYKYHGRVKALAESARAAGLEF